jgi:histidinol-phosphatase (PHP family)
MKLETCGMVLPADYHMHTPLCRHARGEPEEYALHALKLGLSEIGFSDHAPMPQDDFDTWRMNADKLDEYVGKVRRVQRDFPQLAVRLALEVDYLPGYEDWICDLAARHLWDYFIGSVHYVSDSWAIDDPQKLSEWKLRDVGEVWSVYFERLTKAAETGLFEILGHVDLPKKFGHGPSCDLAPLYRKFLGAANSHNCAVELNTAGLRKDCREIYPSREILQLAFQSGVPITFGSDAHAPGEVGMNFAAAVQLAHEVGYRECCRFCQRKRELVPF